MDLLSQWREFSSSVALDPDHLYWTPLSGEENELRDRINRDLQSHFPYHVMYAEAQLGVTLDANLARELHTVVPSNASYIRDREAVEDRKTQPDPLPKKKPTFGPSTPTVQSTLMSEGWSGF